MLRYVIAIATIIGIYYATSRDHHRDAGEACVIKGNISAHGKIYHMPGDMYYDKTRIDPLSSERWFCSEDEARQAGWRRTRR